MARIVKNRTVPDFLIPDDVSVADFVFKDAKMAHDRTAIIDGLTGEQITYAQMLSLVRRVADGLWRRGFRKGDVALLLPRLTIDIQLLYLALLRLGVTVSAINPLSTVDEIVDRLEDARATAVFVIKDQMAKLQKALERYHKIREPYVFEPDGKHVSVKDLLREGQDVPFPDVGIRPREDVALLPYSSGTSGKPKGVMLSHYSLIAGLGILTAPEMAFDGRPGARLLLFVPNFHGYGLFISLLTLLRCGTLILLPKYTIEDALRCVETYKVTCLTIVAAVAVELAKNPLVKKYDLTSVEEIHCNGSPVGIQLTNDVRARLPHATFRQGYGLTELIGLSTISPTKNYKDATTGNALPNTQIKVVDIDSGKLLGPNQKGEIWIKAPSVMLGYLGRPEATANTLDQDGFVHTGDIGYYDEDECFHVVDRLKELIKYKSYQVPPAVLEDLLLKHGAVMDVCVVGVPDEVAGELPRAFVVRKPGASLSEQQVIDYTNERVAPYMKLRGGAEFVDTIPRSTNGKILRRLLRDRVRQEHQAKSNL